MPAAPATNDQSAFARLLRPSALRQLLSAPSTRVRLSLAGGLPPDSAMPFDAVAEVVATLMSKRDSSALQYSSAEGDHRLREAIAAWVSPGLGRPVDAGSIIVTTGTQQALDLLARILLDPGDDAVVESPTYVGALRVIAPTGARICEIGVDDDGLDVDILEARLLGGLRPKLVYLVANFSNPSGATISAARRHRLIDLAERFRFVIIEDDQYGRLRFAGMDQPAIASLTGHANTRTVYLSGFSKVVAPGVRVGFCVLPDWLRRSVTLAKQATDLAAQSLGQRVITELLARPAWLDEHIATVRQTYRSHAAALLAGIDESLDGRLTVRRPKGGMFTWATIRHPDIDAVELARRSLERGLLIMPGSEFSLADRFPQELRLSFSNSTPEQLGEACAVMAAAFDDR